MTENSIRRSLWKELLAGALLCVFVLGLAIAAAPPPALGAWFGRAAFAGHRHGDWGDNPERARKHAEFMTGFVLDEVDATPEQTEQVTTIVLGFMQEVQGLKVEHRTRHQELMAALSQPEISRAELESLRAEQLATLDGVSQKLIDAIVSAAAVLTTEQRARLVELAQEMHESHAH
jgi:Spy/CpxP family protein refolding chaperone